MRQSREEKQSSESGQTVLEYVLLLSMIGGFYLIVMNVLSRIDIATKLTAGIQGSFASTYKYGHPKAKGPDEGDPEYHPRFYTGEDGTNFRLFLNPGAK